MLSELKETLSGKKTDKLATELVESKEIQQEHSQKISTLKGELAEAKSSIVALTAKQQQLINENTNALRTVKELKEQLEESIESIKVLSSTIQNHLVRKITDEISTMSHEISSKLSGSEKLKREIEEIATNVKDELRSLTEEIKRLQTVSSHIKAEDFELSKFADQLTAADNEKLRLMRQIDSLQRLVSSLRRRQH